MQIGENPIVIPLLSAIISGLISLCIGYFLHKRKVDIDVIQVHFKELKEYVISPTVKILESTSNDMPSWKQVVKEPFNTYRIDSELCHDLLNNHYPQIISIWDKFVQLNKRMEEMHCDIVISISNKTKKVLDSFNIECFSKGDDRQSVNENVIYLDKFVNRISKLIIEYRYDEKEFILASEGQAILLSPGHPDAVIFYSKDTDICKKMLTNLKQLGHILNSSAEIQEIVNNYNILTTEQSKVLRNFKRLLNTILRKTSLHLQKEWIFRNRCKFIRPKLTVDG